ncbi:TniB family NTP-binding protein [Vibrio caribbeanicus]|uniref:TniB family NTP-binding protein n=1 Tax=Vibrio caribbeanicus TaxID=701175 RepID=UPI002283E750|nr:TniB family NTP-binding protein [Vibrio caribbeanicus]MCY9844540.1 TniB family NTP-binding protein [Vibrio caribbeanicus]
MECNEVETAADHVKRIFINSPEISDIFDDISDCREFSDGIHEPDCMIVVGDTGSGKTTLIERYLAKNPRSEKNDGSVIPILSTSLPPNATPITASEQLLSDLGDPLAFSRGSDPVKVAEEMGDLMKSCGVELIIIDEFQHMIDRKNKQVLHSAADWLKMLIVRSKIPVVLFGMPYSVVILEANHQLAGRFELQHTLEPFRLDNKENLILYKTFLIKLDEALPFNESSALESRDMMKRIYAFSKGNLRRIRKLINRSTRLALRDKSNKILLEHFAEAAPKVSRAACEKHNPFQVKVSELHLEHPPRDIGWENYLNQIEKDISPRDIF